MTNLSDLSIEAMNEIELRSELVSLRNRYRSLNRRSQHTLTAKKKNVLQGELAYAKEAAEYHKKLWLSEFGRVGRSFAVAKQIYEIAAKKLGLPYGSYNSVSDLSGPEAGQLYAHVYLYPQGGIKTFNVLECVERAVNEPHASSRERKEG